MKCPDCGAAHLIHDTRDLSYTYKGETTVIPMVTADFCPACDESVTDLHETDRVMREMQAFNKRVNASIVDPAFIVKVRRKLDLGQREAAESFGGGVNVTLGLPFIRTSVDHGTALDLAGSGRADPGSLVAAVKLACELAARRKAQ